MSLKARITDDMKAAMKARETERLGAIRLLLAAIKQREVDERVELDETAVLAIVEKLIKQRRDSITQYEAAQRKDLAAKERFEADLLATYLPARLTAAEISTEIERAASECGAASAADMGKLMALLKPRLAGRADMGEVSRLVKARLSGTPS
ncbi:MAG TPA: GatB/YqeY domain-containing protein [Rhodocyclaceae bacterium]